MTGTKRARPAAMTPAELRSLIAAAGLTRLQVAALLGVSPVTVWRWLNGHTVISRKVAAFVKAEIIGPSPAR